MRLLKKRIGGKILQEVYNCTRCGNKLFDADKKFEAGCGFPSFWMPLRDNVTENFLTTYGRERTQLLCKKCGQHLGHLFKNNTTPTQLRYCINSSAINLE
ncbi:MAG: peptide-methionine (R)-S-oxide reductase [Bacteroidota bacterium]|nr:peptide-methionine (R)-S-oxide reductase [Bacteroidota bacterium]